MSSDILFAYLFRIIHYSLIFIKKYLIFNSCLRYICSSIIDKTLLISYFYLFLEFKGFYSIIKNEYIYNFILKGAKILNENTIILITFGLYLAGMLGIGWYFYTKTKKFIRLCSRWPSIRSMGNFY